MAEPDRPIKVKRGASARQPTEDELYRVPQCAREVFSIRPLCWGGIG